MKRVLVVVLLPILGCTTGDGGPTVPRDRLPTATSQGTNTISEAGVSGLFPDVVGVAVTDNGDGTYRFDVTISSPYDSNDQYADAWRVLGPDGNELGVRVLTHPHANEQPFTRSLDGVEIPQEVDRVVVQGRDLINGWGGVTAEVELDK